VSFLEFLVIAYSFLAFILVVLLASPAGQRMDKKRSRIDRNSDSFGEIRPNEYTTLSADIMVKIQVTIMTIDATVTPLANPTAMASSVI
jgi:hypothetical protein